GWRDTAPRRRTGPATWPRGPGCCGGYASRVFPMGEAPADIVADGPCRLLTERREARPVVDVDQHGTVGLGERHVAPEHLQAENRRRLERERLQAVLIHLRSLSGEPRLRAVPPEETSVRDAVELHDRTGHMLLQRHPGDASRGERPQLLCHALTRGRDNVLRPLGVDVAPIAPDLLAVGAHA